MYHLQLLAAGLGAAAAVWSAGFVPKGLGTAVAAGVDAPWPADAPPNRPPPNKLFPEAPPVVLPATEGAEPKRPPPPNVLGTALPNNPPEGAGLAAPPAAGVPVVLPKRPPPEAGVVDAPVAPLAAAPGLLPRAPNKPPPAAGVVVLLAVLPKRPVPGVVVVALPPVFPNSPPPLPAAGVAAFPPVLPNRPPAEDCPVALGVPNKPPPVAGFAALFPKRLAPEPITERGMSSVSNWNQDSYRLQTGFRLPSSCWVPHQASSHRPCYLL